MGLCARAKSAGVSRGGVMAAVSCPPAVFKARKLYFRPKADTPRAASGNPLIFHDFAPECQKAAQAGAGARHSLKINCVGANRRELARR